MTRNQNHDDASSRKKIKTCDNGGVAPWSDLAYDVLFLVMMQLGVVDFLAFSRVCKSWRSLAVSNRNSFIVSRPPMSISFSTHTNDQKRCYLKDIEGRKLKTILPHSAGRTCFGVTCGYLVLFGKKTSDFWLVNPITRHELHFPNVPFYFPSCKEDILILSPSIYGWVFVVYGIFQDKIWFSIAGKGEWAYFSTPSRISNLHAFNGKIYALDFINRLYEVRLCPTPEMTLLEIKNFPNPEFYLPGFLNSGENLYVMELFSKLPHNIHEINFSKMEWVSCEKEGAEYAFFLSNLIPGVAVLQGKSWADLHLQYRRHAFPDETGKDRFFHAKMWYFFQDCLNVNLLH